MKICLYLEFRQFLGGTFYKNIGTGLLSSYENQKRCLKALNIPFVEDWQKDCDILQINTPWIRSLWLIKKARKLGKKVIIWAHVTAEDAMQVFWFNKYFGRQIRWYLKMAYGQADIVFCPSAHTKNLLSKYGLDPNKLIVQSNGVDCLEFYEDLAKRNECRAEHQCENTLVVGTVGLVIPRKGVDLFIELAKKYPEQKFIWFGKIYSKLMAKGLPPVLPPNVKFTGFVKDICAAFNAIDIFIFLSSEENQGMVLLEAAACGRPILVKYLPAYEGWLKHDENCLIARSDEEVQKYLTQLINDEALRARLSQGAKKLAASEDIKEQNKKLMEIYSDLL